MNCASSRGRSPAKEAQLMTALTRTGRPAEALAVYAGIRAALKEELGSSPSAALEDAQADALRGSVQPLRSAEAAGPARVATIPPAQLPSPLPGFAGRQVLLAALHEESRGRSRSFLITGMAGVGKTTLALRYANDLAHEYPDGQLYLNLRGFDATAPPIKRSILAAKQVLVVLDNAHDYQQVEPFDDKEVIDFFSQRLSASRVGHDRETMIRLGRACGGPSPGPRHRGGASLGQPGVPAGTPRSDASSIKSAASPPAWATTGRRSCSCWRTPTGAWP